MENTKLMTKFASEETSTKIRDKKFIIVIIIIILIFFPALKQRPINPTHCI